MNGSRFSRRSLLAGLGGAAFVPLLHAQNSAFGAAPVFPRRLVVVYWPNGVVPNQFWPTAPAGDNPLPQVLPATLTPLAPFREKISVLGGLELKDSPCNGHGAIGQLLSGAGVPPGAPNQQLSCPFDYSDPPGGVTLDQYVHERIGQDKRLLTLGVQCRTDSQLISWSALNVPRVPEQNPYQVAANLLGGRSSGGGAEVQRRLAARMSVLDFVKNDLAAFETRVGREDRQKVQSHITAIRDLERQLSSQGTCSGLGGTPVDPARNENFPAVTRAQMDLVSLAFACDVSRVATITLTNAAAGEIVFSWLGREFCGNDDPTRCEPGTDINDPINSFSHHAIAHGAIGGKVSGAPRVGQKVRVDQWYYEQVAYLLSRLDAVREGDGTMLDNTAVLCVNTQSDGGNHYVGGLPWVLAGSCGGALRTGRFFNWGAWRVNGDNVPEGSFVPVNGVLTALANAVIGGAPLAGFGRFPGEVPGLRVT